MSLRVYWDTMLFVYWLEDHPRFASRVEQIHRGMVTRGDQLLTSTLTVGEVQEGTYRHKDVNAAKAYGDFFRFSAIEIIPFSFDTAERYAQIRGQHHVAAADAIHLATAAAAGVTFFITNDRRLAGKQIEGIGFVTGLDINVY